MNFDRPSLSHILVITICTLVFSTSFYDNKMSIMSRLLIPMKKPIPSRYFLRYSSTSLKIYAAFDRVILVRLFSLAEGMKSPAIFELSWIIRCLNSDSWNLSYVSLHRWSFTLRNGKETNIPPCPSWCLRVYHYRKMDSSTSTSCRSLLVWNLTDWWPSAWSYCLSALSASPNAKYRTNSPDMGKSKSSPADQPAPSSACGPSSASPPPSVTVVYAFGWSQNRDCFALSAASNSR